MKSLDYFVLTWVYFKVFHFVKTFISRVGNGASPDVFITFKMVLTLYQTMIKFSIENEECVL